MRGSEDGIVLLHGRDDADVVELRWSEVDSDGPDVELECDGVRAAQCWVIEVQPSGGAERGVSCEGEFFFRREDADTDALLCFDGGIAGEDESCLGEIGLSGEGLHLCGGEGGGVMEDRERIARERLFGEDIEDGVVESAGHASMLQISDVGLPGS